MTQVSWLLAALALSLLLLHTLQLLVYKFLRYRQIRRPQNFEQIMSLLRASTYELETEAEGLCQLGSVESRKDNSRSSSQQSFFHDAEMPNRSELDSLVEALGDSPFFKTLDSQPLTALAEALQAEGHQLASGQHVRCDCFYQSDEGIQQLFVLSDPETQVRLSLQTDGGSGLGADYFTKGGRLLYSPSGLAYALLPESQKHQCSAWAFSCSMHARMSFWSISCASLAQCLATWPDARRRLLLQFWSHINDTVLLVLVDWLGLDASMFLESKVYEDMLARETDNLVDEVYATMGAKFSAMSFYERRPLYQRLSIRLLKAISETNEAINSAESQVVIKYFSSSSKEMVLDGQRAFLVLEGRLEIMPTQKSFGGGVGSISSSILPGWVGLVPYFAHSRLPFQVRPAAENINSAMDSEDCGAVVAEFPDALMDKLFRSESSTEAATNAAAGFLLRQLTRQVFLYDLLINHRRLHRGDYLVRSRDPTDTVEIIVSGRLRHVNRSELARGDCVGLIEGLIHDSPVEARWAGDILATRESRAVSMPLALARAWVSPTQRLNILDRLLGSLCEVQLDQQQQQLKQLEDCRVNPPRIRRHRKYTGCESDIGDDTRSYHEEEATSDKNGTVWLTSKRSTRQSRLIGLEIDPTRFNQQALMQHIQLCLEAMHKTGSVRVVSESDAEQHFGLPTEQLPEAALRNWLEDQELTSSVLVLISTGQVNRWTRQLLGFLDCLIIFCDADTEQAESSGELPSPAEQLYSSMHRSRLHVAILHPLTLCPVPEGTSLRFLRNRRFWAQRHYHVRCSTGRYKLRDAATQIGQPPASHDASYSDLARLMRCVTGAGVGLAFGNAAPFGLANLGVLEALLADGVAVDMIAGSGLGALTAAAWALHTGDLGATRASLQRHWACINSRWSRLRDITLPLVSIYTGASLNASLRSLFGSRRQAEDLWLPFVAVSTDLVAVQAVTHTTGTLWRSVRASCGQVGVYPPVWEPRTGRLLLDGAHTDRLPACTLRRCLKARWVVAAAMESKMRLQLGTYLVFGDYVSGFTELARSLNPFRLTPLAPSGAEIQAALAYLAASDEVPIGGANDDAGNHEAAAARESWCITVRPDPSFSDASAVEAERWRGYWSVRRRLLRLETFVRAALRGCGNLSA